RQARRDLVDRQGQLMRLLPDLEFAKVFHLTSYTGQRSPGRISGFPPALYPMILLFKASHAGKEDRWKPSASCSPACWFLSGQRTRDYQHWVEAFARNHRIPLRWPDKDMKKKGFRQQDYVRPYLRAMERRKRFGVYFIFKTMESGPTFHSRLPKYPTDDPHYRILKRNWSPYTHYYLYIRE